MDARSMLMRYSPSSLSNCAGGKTLWYSLHEAIEATPKTLFTKIYAPSIYRIDDPSHDLSLSSTFEMSGPQSLVVFRQNAHQAKDRRPRTYDRCMAHRPCRHKWWLGINERSTRQSRRRNLGHQDPLSRTYLGSRILYMMAPSQTYVVIVSRTDVR